MWVIALSYAKTSKIIIEKRGNAQFPRNLQRTSTISPALCLAIISGPIFVYVLESMKLRKRSSSGPIDRRGIAVPACSKIWILWPIQLSYASAFWICYRYINVQCILHSNVWAISGSRINRSTKKVECHNFCFFYAWNYLSSYSNILSIWYYWSTIYMYR